MRAIPNTMAATTVLTHAPAANTAATKTVAADADHTWVLQWLHVSFDAAPASPVTLDVSIGGSTVWSVDIAAAGVFRFDYGDGLWNTDANGTAVKNEALVVTLPAGGAAKTGKINFAYR